MRSAIYLCWLVSVAAGAAPLELDPSPVALARAIQGHRIVLLGEVHDNAGQHALRAVALRQWVMQGARPAIAFEQFDREHQADIDRARRERPTDADFLIAQAKGSSGWHWEYYRPFVALALEFDLPIVATNLSRGEAMRVATDGWAAVFDAATHRALRLDALPADLRRKQEQAIAAGHCNQLPADAVPALTRAQIARDIVMAQSLRPYADDRAVVLLAGNGHVRRDIGVPHWLPADARRAVISIGMLEHGDRSEPEAAADFDAYVMTARAERPDPCKELAKELRPGTAR
jgi:uncharacterized iron-regulated protein